MTRFKIGQYVNYKGTKRKVLFAYSDGDLRIEGISDFIHESKVEKWSNKPVTNTKLNTLSKLFLRAKLRLPEGMTLNPNESDYVIDTWQREQDDVTIRQNSLQSSAENIDRHLKQTLLDIPLAMSNLKDARKNYKSVKTKVSKAKWARKIVIRAAYYEQLRDSYQSLNATVERVRDILDDAQYVYKTLQSRIEEARIYKELNGGLKLVGKSLQDARTKHVLPDVEYSSLEVSMEDIENATGKKSTDELLLEAENIINDKSRWISDESEATDNTTQTQNESKAKS